jgi:23S rRNA (uracil1939-C5)-methyltransferase
LLSRSPDRVEPPCPHFGRCGGCVLQHWSDERYVAWKADQLQAALRRAGFDIKVNQPARAAAHERRRVDFALRRRAGAVIVGLHAARSAEVVDILECPVLAPPLMAMTAPLRAMLREISGLRREGSAVVNLLDNGPDLLLRGDAPLRADDRTRLARFAAEQGISRISWAVGKGEPETAAQLLRPEVALGGVSVSPPAGAFLQASAAGEAAIVSAALAGLPKRLPAKARVADLYAGNGTLTFPLAQRTRVDAFEGDAQAAASLREAARQSSLGGRITVAARDLTRQPLAGRELAAYAALVVDPPYAGAPVQSAEIARARVPCVVYVSCNPAALARDAALFAAAGYRLTAATPIDQFLWSARLESVCVFALTRG